LNRPSSYTKRLVQMSNCTSNSDITRSNRSMNGGECSHSSDRDDPVWRGSNQDNKDEQRPPGLSAGQRSLITIAMQPQSSMRKRSGSGSASESSTSSGGPATKPDYWGAVNSKRRLARHLPKRLLHLLDPTTRREICMWRPGCGRSPSGYRHA
jgi:hypothetical protein